MRKRYVDRDRNRDTYGFYLIDHIVVNGVSEPTIPMSTQLPRRKTCWPVSGMIWV